MLLTNSMKVYCNFFQVVVMQTQTTSMVSKPLYRNSRRKLTIFVLLKRLAYDHERAFLHVNWRCLYQRLCGSAHEINYLLIFNNVTNVFNGLLTDLEVVTA